MGKYDKRAPVTVNPVVAHPEERRLSLDGKWNFKLDPCDVGLQERWFENFVVLYETIEVPGCWQGQGFGGDEEEEIWDFGLRERIYRATYQGTAWYGKAFRVPEEFEGCRLWLNFGGVHPSCRVWVNGKELGSHNAPFVPFAFEITDTVDCAGENFIVVRVSEEDRILGLGFNGQGSWSGLYRGVEITATGNCYLDRFRAYPDSASGKITIKADVKDYALAAQPLSLVVAVFEAGSSAIKADTNVTVTGETLEATVSIPKPKLWSPDSPSLYRIEALLSDGKGAVMDALSVRVGFVTLSATDQHILINGKPYYMRGAGDFLANPETGCPDTNRERWRRKLATLREYGYNYIRCQSFVPAPEFFDVADEVGLLVQSEMGMVGAWGGISKWHIFHWPRPNPDMRQKLKWQWDHVVMRDVNHPSANIYCMSNEVGSFGNVPLQILHPRITWQCYHETKAVKPTAFVIWSDGGKIDNGVFQMPCDFMNDNTTDDDRTQKRTRPLVQHEYKWWSSFPDVRIALKYSGAMRPYGAEIAIKAAGRHNLTHMLPVFAQNSQRLQFIEAKGKLEELRRDFPYLAGVTHFNAVDLNPSPQGILDEFYDKKYVESATWLQTNGDTVILMSKGFDERVLSPGEKFRCDFSVSDFSHPALRKPVLKWKLVDKGRVLGEGEIAYPHIPYETCPAGGIEIALPDFVEPAQVKLTCALTEGNRVFTNSWDFWVFPERRVGPENAVIYGSPAYTWLKEAGFLQSVTASQLKNAAGQRVVLTETLDEAILEHVVGGGRAVLAASEGYVRPSSAALGLVKGRYFFTPPANWAPFEEGQNGTVIAGHPMLGAFPHEGFADLQFYRMMAESAPIDSEPLGLQDRDPVIRVIHRYMVSRHLAHLVELRCGKGLLVLCSMDLNQAWPEASYLLAEICAYLSGADGSTAQPVSEEQLRNIAAIGNVQ